MKLSNLPTGTRVVYLGPGTEFRINPSDPTSASLFLDAPGTDKAPTVLVKDIIVPPKMLVVHDSIGFIGSELAEILGPPDRIGSLNWTDRFTYPLWDVQP